MYIYMFMGQRETERQRESARWCKTAGVAAAILIIETDLKPGGA